MAQKVQKNTWITQPQMVADNHMMTPSHYNNYDEYLKSMIKLFNLDNPAPYVTARSWVMTSLETGEILYAKQDKEQRQVASLTKIMTYYSVAKIMESNGLDPDFVIVNILESSTSP
jgi:D-alanyl-D-alanine carboxypeptidase